LTAPARPPKAARRAAVVRHEVTGTLEAVSPLRVGGWAGTVTADLVVARDGLDRVVIPGTSLAGALRAWLGTVTGPDGESLFPADGLGIVFGDLTPGTEDGELCLIRVDDAVTAGEVMAGVRDGVGIDRITGSAARGLLYQHEVLPPGSQFAVRITASQLAGDPQRVGEALDLIIRALADGRVEIGAARTRGLGLIRLTDVHRAAIDLTDRSHVLSWLCGRLPPQAQPEPEPADREPLPDGKLGIEITWSPATPVMVQASTATAQELAEDPDLASVPLRAATGPDGQTRLLLPGSSIKGVLRSHAERITRTILGYAELPEDWLDQVNDPRLGPVGALFGLARPKAEDEDDDDDGTGTKSASLEGRRGAVSVHDCHASSSAERTVTHVAIDRWTGGAAENLLFSVREPATADWQPIIMTLDTRRIGGSDPAEAGKALALLLLVLRDLADGWLALGFGGTRGRGAVTVSEVSFTGSGLPEPWASLAGHTLADLIDHPPDSVTQAFTAWAEEETP
jgi:CRISPR/Cas system CSM-associated protein Csm3 (group 7 of RAMP superfamily)